jgi:hypothetical protein
VKSYMKNQIKKGESWHTGMIMAQAIPRIQVRAVVTGMSGSSERHTQQDPKEIIMDPNLYWRRRIGPRDMGSHRRGQRSVLYPNSGHRIARRSEPKERS